MFHVFKEMLICTLLVIALFLRSFIRSDPLLLQHAQQWNLKTYFAIQDSFVVGSVCGGSKNRQIGAVAPLKKQIWKERWVQISAVSDSVSFLLLVLFSLVFSSNQLLSCPFHPTCRQPAILLLLEEASLGFCEKYPMKQQDSPQSMKTIFSCMGNGATAMVVNIGTYWQWQNSTCAGEWKENW